MNRGLLLSICLSAAAPTENQDHSHLDAMRPTTGAQVIVTINPEARVSTVFAGSMPPPSKCGKATELNVLVVNQAFVTAPLRARIVGSGAGRVAIQMDNSKLSGGSQDSRWLHLIPKSQGTTDVTIAFSVANNIGDSGEHDKLHILMRCSTA